MGGVRPTQGALILAGARHWGLVWSFGSDLFPFTSFLLLEFFRDKYHCQEVFCFIRVKFFSIFVVANQFEEGKQNALLSLLPTVFITPGKTRSYNHRRAHDLAENSIYVVMLLHNVYVKCKQ